MASAMLGAELSCSICLSTYTDPVYLRCGHNFCQDCIVSVLDTQEGAGVYSCPECRAEYQERPALEKNRKLSNIVERFLCSHPEPEETRIFCTYCDSPMPATKTCLQCDASFCDKHLSKHSKSAEHVLTEPTVSFEVRKCSIHKETVKYYCSEDSAAICMSCCVAGDHRGHHVELLSMVYEKKKETLKSVTETLKSEREETERRGQRLQDHMREEKEKATNVTKRVTDLFREIREKLDTLERQVLSEISRQEEQMSLSVSDLITQLETQKDELSRKISSIEEMCNIITDPLTFLKKEPESDVISQRSCDVTSNVRDTGCVDKGIISQMLHRGLLHLADNLMDLQRKRQLSVMEKADMLLDIKTANNNIIISRDHRSASYTDVYQKRRPGPERFIVRQVFSSCSFSSGRHYWELDVSKAKKWLIGVAGHSIERKVDGPKSCIGYNDKSWSLFLLNFLGTSHNNIHKEIEKWGPGSSVQTVGIYLDYEAGRLSFYQLCDPIRHLHTFSATFTEPLYAAFFLYDKCCITIVK
ncbi:tripartite motif-containing protein 75-like [Pseudophryne corroboree]|uniref:tripartite motif-containing protein 75-like n=1 Tax=Pseudophryne corroboree TaxID=495146 RepID=UPI003081DF66